MTRTGAVVLLALAAAALLGPFLMDGDPFAMVGPPLSPPSGTHLFGTDDLGRDVLTAVVYGARTSLYVGFAAATVAGSLGLLVGGLAAVRGGLTDHVLMRGADFVHALPRFLLIVTLVSLFGHSFVLIVLAIGLTEWPVTARLFRAHAMSTLERDFVFAARAAGATDAGLLIRHALPLAASVVGAQISFHAGGAILIESGLSVLGLGDPAVMSWGTMLGAAQRFIRDAWWISLFPGLAITVTVLACNVIGEGLVRRRAAW